MSMYFALEIDWGSKSEQEFQDGSVSAMSVVLASPRRKAPRNALLCRVGRVPVRDSTRPLVPGKRTHSRPTGLMEGALKSGFARLAFCHPPEQHR